MLALWYSRGPFQQPVRDFFLGGMHFLQHGTCLVKLPLQRLPASDFSSLLLTKRPNKPQQWLFASPQDECCERER